MVAGLGLSILRCLWVHGSRTGLEEITTLRKSLLPFKKRRFRFVYFAMSSGTWQQNGFGGVHNTAKEPPSFF